MRRTLLTTLALGCLATPLGAETLYVSTPEPTGEGSFQAALDAAAASPEASSIFIASANSEIVTTTGLTYTGTSPLGIYGNGLTLRASENVTLFTATNPSIIGLRDMDFVGPGGFTLEARGDLDGPAGRAVFLDVAEDATGPVSLRLVGVRVSGVAGHGIYIADCGADAECDGEGAPASIVVELAGVAISNLGHGTHDADGIRVDERGPGDITLTAMHMDVERVGGDGIELDEGGAGDVIVDLIHSTFVENGSYCDPATLAAYLPNAREGEFREAQMTIANLPQPADDTPDMRCLELEVDTFDDGSVEYFEYALDVDDGLDIDEAGPGSIIGSLSVGGVIGNYDEGYDFDEEGPGDIDVVFTGLTGNGNADNAIKLSEEGPGDVYVTATAVEASANGSVGIVVEEDDGGDLAMVLVGSATSGNDGGELGIEAVQEGDGVGNVYVIDTEVADGIDTDGVTLDAD